MKIGIIGGGSIGLLFAFYLSQRQPVCLYVRTNEQKNLLKEEGLHLVRGNEEWRQQMEVKLCSEWRGLENVTFIALKQYQLQNMDEILQMYGRAEHALVFLQNGMGHLKLLDRLNGDLYVAAVEQGSMRTSGNCVCHTGIGSTRIAAYRQANSGLLPWLESEFTHTFPFHIEEDYEVMLLKKLVVNAVINPLTAVLQVKNGDLITNPSYFQLVQHLFKEIEQGLQLFDGGYFENVLSVCRKTAENQSSMLRDLLEKRPTEVDAILGYILESAEENEINTPVIKAFYFAVKGKECQVKE